MISIMGRLNTGQRVVIVIAWGLALAVVGEGVLSWWEGGTQPFTGWVGYAPLASTAFSPPRRVLHPWVLAAYWLTVVIVWAAGALTVMRNRSRGTEPSTS